MSKSFIIIGLGRFGTSTARMLTTLGHEVLVVDKRADRVNGIKDSVMHAVQADATDERALSQLGVRNFDTVVICIGDDIRASIRVSRGTDGVVCEFSPANCAESYGSVSYRRFTRNFSLHGIRAQHRDGF